MKKLARRLEFVSIEDPEYEVLPGEPLAVYSEAVGAATADDVSSLETDVAALEANRDYFTVSFFIPGTLAANAVITWQVPFACTLVEVSGVASNNSDATIMIGIAADTDSIRTATAIGDSGTPAVITTWNGVNTAGTVADNGVLVFTLDYDGLAGTAAQNVTLVFTFKKALTT